MSAPDLERLQSIKTLPSLIVYLRDELAWPIEADDMEDVFFDYDPAELGLASDQAAKIKEIKQLRPLDSKQPWGIFWVNFEKKSLPVVMLRRILGHLVVKKRASANKAAQRAWQLNDLLFISAYGEDTDRAITFAHFAQEAESPDDLPVLKVLGWDGGDTVMHLADAHRILTEKLRWPDDPRDIAAWRNQWGGAFPLRHRQVITTTQELVEALANVAVSIRKTAERILPRESERGPLRRLYAAFKTALIHDLSEDDFADVIAQTISYGLLAARFSKAEKLSVQNLVEMLPRTNPFLRGLVEMLLVAAGRKKGAFDFDELGIQDVVELLNNANAEAVKSDFGNRTRNEDPVIHFYEHFLHVYDHAKKVQRGVFFTPLPAVSYIVRSVHELLQTEFGLEDGLADTTTWGEMVKRNKDLKIPDGAKPGDPFVLVLDVATGTATFLVEVIEVIFTHLKAKWDKHGLAGMPRLPEPRTPNPGTFAAYWNAYVPAALFPRLYGYELMMAPYTIAHMKIGLKLSEINARLGQPDYEFKFEGRAHIYLTNSLEPAGDDRQGTLEGIFPALAHEAAAVNEVKRHKRFTIVIGNPPYSGIAANMSEYAQRMIDAYKIVDGEALNERKLWLQDDYVKFIRFAQSTLDQVPAGVLGYITNHGYLDNPTFRGMRQSLMSSFPRIRVLDLHGNMNKKERAPDGGEDQNVFDIRQGVAICLATHGPVEVAVRHADLWGLREAKYAWLVQHRAGNTSFAALAPDSPFYFLEPQDAARRAEYEQGWSLVEVFTKSGVGMVTARDALTIDLDAGVLWQRVKHFAALPVERARNEYDLGADVQSWRVAWAQEDVRKSGPSRQRVHPIMYRPFDLRFTYYTGNSSGFICRPVYEVMRHMISCRNLALVTTRSVEIGRGYEHVFCSRGMIQHHTVSLKEVNYLFPLRVAAEEGGQRGLFDGDSEAVVNLSATFMDAIGAGLRAQGHTADNLPVFPSPEDIFHYTYAVLHSPGYRSRYAEFLRIDFPRLPLPGSIDLFRDLAKLGGELVALHLMETPKLDKHITKWVGGKNPEVEKVTYANETVWTDKVQAEGFRGVPEAVWSFHIGGYQVCEKWLKDRKGRTLSADDITHYQKIVVALHETIRLMAEIDEVIETHGGWPAAFQAPAPA